MSSQKCSAGLVQTTKDTIVLALEVGDQAVLKSPERIKAILQDKTVWDAVEKVLKAEGARLVKTHQAGKPVTQKEVVAMGKKALTAGGNAAANAAKKQITDSAEYKQLKQSLNQLGCSFKRSPIGVFVDENKGWLILVGVGVAVGGATAMYVLRDGDGVAKQATSLANKSLRFKVLGNVEVGAKALKFVPSKREVAMTTFADIKWTNVQTKFEAAVAFKDDKLASASARGEVTVKVAEGLKLTGHGKAGYKRPTEVYQPSLVYDFGLGLSYKPGAGISMTAMAFAMQDQTQQKIGGKGSVNLRVAGGKKSTDPSVGINLSGSGSRNTQFGPKPKTSSELQFNLGVAVNF